MKLRIFHFLIEKSGVVQSVMRLFGITRTMRNTERSIVRLKNSITEPSYYQKGIQPIDYIESWQMDYCAGNVLKYLTRYPYKNGRDDLLKAKWYLDRLITNHTTKGHNNNG